MNYSIKITSRFILCCLVAAVGSLYSWEANARCNSIDGWNSVYFDLAFPDNIPVDPNLPIGSRFYLERYSIGSGPYAYCSGSHNITWRYLDGLETTPPSNIAPTNVPGVGIRLSQTNVNYFPFDVYSGSASHTLRFRNAGFSVELMKTGPISGGTLRTGNYARLAAEVPGSTSGYYIAIIHSSSGGGINNPTCSVEDTLINVPMGTVNTREFSGVGSVSSPQTFNIGLQCETDAKINLTLNATADESDAEGVLALSSSPDNATGVGIQLTRNGEPVTLNEEISIGTVEPGSKEVSIALAAQYYQTAEAIIPGKASATATFTMSYN